MNGHKDVCIKRGSFCPVCKGIRGEDCWHEAHEFQSGSFKYERLERELAEAERSLAAMQAAKPVVDSEVVEVLRDCLPKNVCLTNRNVRDDAPISLECTIGDLRRIAALLAKLEGTGE